ncbi:MAG: autotransporter-associated beta strand repeat-containing protein [Verrucomicrobiae bacterium]|nr:autotransporter-associated beta strand repeat-containing protein [Verrucomicrobiae bacterium]
MKNLLKYLLVIVALVTLSRPALADQTWLGGTDNNWTTPANWSGNALPTSGDWVFYNNLSTSSLSNWLGADFTVGNIIVSNPPAPVSINSDVNTLTLLAGTGVGINLANATQPLAISANVALGGGQSWVVASNQALTVSGVVSGSYGLYKDGLGTLNLSGANTFTGNFTNNGGAVWINNSAALGTSPKTIYIANNNVGAGLHLNGTNGNISLPTALQFTVSDDKGTIINEAGDNTINGNMFEFSGGGQAYMVVNAGTLTLNGPIGLSTTARPFQFGGPGNGLVYSSITGAGIAVRKVDAGTWTFYSNNNQTNVTTVEAGTLALGPSATMQNTYSINVFSNATFDVSQPGTFNLSAGSINQTLMGSGAINGSIGCTGPATIQGGANNVPGTLTFSNNLTLNANSTLYFNLGAATTPGGGTNSLLNVMGNLDPQAANIQINPVGVLTSPGSYVLVNYGSESSLFNAVASPGTRYTYTLNDNGVNQLRLNVAGGPTNLVWSGASSGGLWDITNTVNWNNGSQKFYNGDSVSFDDTSANTTVTLGVTAQPGAVLFTNSTQNYTLAGSGKISGFTGLTKAGSGTLAITTTGHNFTGPVMVNGGTLIVASVALNGSASTLGAGTNITLNGGTFEFGGARPTASQFNRFWTLGANGGTILSTNGVFFIPNTISGPGSLTKTGGVQIILGDIVSGVLTNANNTYSGNTFITQGELQIRSAHALGTGKAVVTSGADLAVGGGGNYGTITNNIDLNGDGPGPSFAGALEANDAGTVVNFGGTINLVSAATVGVFSGPNGFTISGPITGPGTLKKGSHAVCTVILTCPTNNYTGGTLNTGGTLQLGSGTTCGSLGSGAVTNNGTLAYNHSDSITNNSLISGTGNLTHTGGGTLTLGGANTYSGTTAVNGGTVQVNGALGANTVTVATNATLGGYGVIGGAVTVQGGGTLALGTAVGTLTVNNTLNLAGTNIMKVSHVTSATNDAIAGLTTVTLGGTLNIVASGTLQSGDTFHLFNAATYAGTFSTTNLPALSSGLSWDASGLTNGTLKVVGGTPAAPQFVQAPFQLGDGNFQLKFSGTSGNYRLWTTTNLTFKPVTSTWTLLTSGTFSGGTVTFKDNTATNYPQRFYVITTP